ncbi:MAG: SIS domain-containing protein [Collinsella aerofaciens]
MQETEKIEIMHFDQEGYLADGKAAVEAGKKMAQIADRVADEGYDAVFLMGVGGTWDELMQLEYLMNKFGDKDLEVYLIHAAEWNVMGHKRMTEKSVVLTASESGTTPEVLEAVKKFQADGRAHLRHDQARGPDRPGHGGELHSHGVQPRRGRLRDGLRLPPTASACACSTAAAASPSSTCSSSRPRTSGRSRTCASASSPRRRSSPASTAWLLHQRSSAPARFGARRSCSPCASSRRCRKRTRYITSHDFFHGTLELLEPGVPVVLFKGEDECRARQPRRGLPALRQDGR